MDRNVCRKIGIDLGSTTAKVVMLDESNNVIYKSYKRHFTRLIETVTEILADLKKTIGDVEATVCLTGSGAMGLCESLGLHFEQEVVAATTTMRSMFPQAKVLVDIGGEDAKLVLLHENKFPEIHMNGNCAGGTGAFIDQMATLLNVDVDELSEFAAQSTDIYPIASRCGVFAKTDVQNLIARKVSLPNVAASIFHAVALQTINTLARGCNIVPQVIFCGGPMCYIPSMRKAFVKLLKLGDNDYTIPDDAQLFTAKGAALMSKNEDLMLISRLMETLNREIVRTKSEEEHIAALFTSKQPVEEWDKCRKIKSLLRKECSSNQKAYLGIDSGSTTTKIVAIDADNDGVLYSYYANNQGNPLGAAITGIEAMNSQILAQGKQIEIVGTAVTGYGEDLLRAAFNIDYGIVETIAHYLAAKKIDPNVSFVLDIGGQDIKAIFAEHGTITNIEINEACSSGCGSFIEGFAKSLGYTPSEFSDLACKSLSPCDLGSRCTVFMNSRVRQAIKDGASVEDIAAGLAYSVVKNCLYKVLNINYLNNTGDNIVVQGGTFRNKAVFRALELLSGKKISSSDMPELMGAYGAALYVKSKHNDKPTTFIGLDNLKSSAKYEVSSTTCKSCTNHCVVTVFRFPNGKKCYSGNKCEKVFTNNPERCERGENIIDIKREIIFNSGVAQVPNSKLRLGIPRVLSIYENYPFWKTLFISVGIEPVLSSVSTTKLYEKGAGSIMSDNICFPAKLSHGHIIDLVEKGVDRVFYPFSLYEKKEFDKSHNCYNCPIVTAYSEVLKNIQVDIPLDAPAFNFNDEKLLKKACLSYLKKLGITKTEAEKAVDKAIEAQIASKKKIFDSNNAIFENAKKNGQPIILLAGHPYHIDQLVHQKISDMLSDMGVAVINEEIAVDKSSDSFRDEYYTISQWAYPNRILQAAAWSVKQKVPVYFVQMNSFGCGPDAIIVDEVKSLLKRYNRSYTLIRIDEISSPGSIKLRLRSLVESIRLKSDIKQKNLRFEKTRPFEVSDRSKTLLVPWFGDFYSPYIPMIGEKLGYKIVNLPKSSKRTLDIGLKVANNEICYPALLVVGDLLSALQSGDYDLDNVAVMISQTGGQCRATNYISLIKRCMVNAGFKNIPVVAIATEVDAINDQPGFDLNYKKVLVPIFHAMFFSDSLSRLYYGTISRELIPGRSEELKNYYIKRSVELLRRGETSRLKDLLREAVDSFNNVACSDRKVQVIGIIGEIFVKYNSYGNYGIVDWLISQGIEVAIPPITNFFMQSFVNSDVNQSQYVSHKKFWSGFLSLGEKLINSQNLVYESVMKSFVRYRPIENVREEAKLATKTVNLLNQYGEGWLIPGEIAGYAKQGITDVVCIQPFGCIANHIIGKGIEKRIKEEYPEINLLFLDFDYGTSLINVLNRLHFMLAKNPELDRC